MKDNTTFKEQRGTTLGNVFKEMEYSILSLTLEVLGYSNQRNRPKGDARVRTFQRKLYLKSKQEKQFSFYVLYDKISLPHFLREAYRRVKSNNGSSGIDGITFKDIESSGLDEFLSTLSEELRTGTYRPQAVLRVMVPKGNNKFRPLGIPPIRDRVAQMSCKMVIEPIFEADFEDSSYGFRPKRGAKDAVSKIKKHLQAGRTVVYDADLSSYFDTIPHEKLLASLRPRISDRRVLHLTQLWLQCPVYENGRYHGGKKNKVGTPQGGVISPLLSNIYLHNLDRIVSNSKRIFSQQGVHIVRYADDFVLMGKEISQDVLNYLQKLLSYMGLRLNAEKSMLVNALTGSFNFLGFTFRFDRSWRNWRIRYWNIFPSEKAQKKLRSTLKELISHRTHMHISEFAILLNSKIRGWMNYFHIQGVSYIRRSCEKLKYHLFVKFNQFFKRKSQRRCKLYSRYGFERYIRKFGIIDPVQAYNLMKPVNA